MKYYFVQKTIDYYTRFGTSGAGLARRTLDIAFDLQGYLAYPEPIQLGILGEEQETKLIFPKYEELHTYLITIHPEVKLILEQFNMPSHKWYKAEVGYDTEFVNNMRKYFNIEYDIDMNEKRDYWILQLLNKKKEELAFDLTDFQLNDYDTFTFKGGGYLGKGAINSYEEYKKVRKAKILAYNLYPEPSIYKYRKNYDVLWGGTHVIFNEKVKSALEATGIITAENGLKFTEFTQYKIEMLGVDSEKKNNNS